MIIKDDSFSKAVQKYYESRIPMFGILRDHDHPEIRTPALDNLLAQLLDSTDRCGWDGGYESGQRINRRKFQAIVAGSGSVMQRRWVDDGISSVISLLIDGSGSMQHLADGKYSRIKIAQGFAFKIARICARARVPLSISVFQEELTNKQNIMSKIDEIKGMHDKYGDKVKEVISEPKAQLIMFKRFDEPANFDHMRYIGNFCEFQTPDYCALRDTIAEIQLRPEQRKIVIVISDGYGDTKRVNALCKQAQKLGVIVIGIGIMCTDFDQVYPISVTVKDSSLELNNAGILKIIKEVRKTEIGRRVF